MNSYILSTKIYAHCLFLQQYHTFEIVQTLRNFIALFFFKSFPSIFSLLIFYKVDFKITLSLYKEKGRKGKKEKTKEGRKRRINYIWEPKYIFLITRTIYLLTAGNVPGILSRGEDNGTPLQYSCLENPMDGGAW